MSDDRNLRAEPFRGVGGVIDCAAIHVFGASGGDDGVFGVVADVEYVVNFHLIPFDVTQIF
jgi:hypothetical protein